MRDLRSGMLGLAGLACIGGVALMHLGHAPAQSAPEPPAAPRAVPGPARAVSAVELDIPSIHVRTPLLQLGLTAAGTLEVPPLDRAQSAGWYRESATPGDRGPAVIVGHVDSDTGPAVFYHLSSLAAGDVIDVTRSDGAKAEYAVTSRHMYTKTHFPTSTVYGSTSASTLRLITCSPPYDPAHGGYQDNLVVFAHLRHLTPSREASS